MIQKKAFQGLLPTQSLKRLCTFTVTRTCHARCTTVFHAQHVRVTGGTHSCSAKYDYTLRFLYSEIITAITPRASKANAI